MNELMIKICGVTHPDDARLAIQLGAERVGMIFYPPARRSVEIEQARAIATATLEAGGIPVGVFVDACVEDLKHHCLSCGIRHVQLHGKKATQLARTLSSEFLVTLNVPVNASGQLVDPLIDLASDVEYLLFDSQKAGSGQSFDWAQFIPPLQRPWVLAGGLSPINVRRAIEQLCPYAVDVSTGVEGGIYGRKDAEKMKAFIQQVRES